MNSESRLGVPDTQKREHGKNMLTPSVRRPLPLPSVTPIDPQAVHAGVEEDLAALLDRDRGDFPVGHQDDAAGAHAGPLFAHHVGGGEVYGRGSVQADAAMTMFVV